jgi:hypothetical protein
MNANITIVDKTPNDNIFFDVDMSSSASYSIDQYLGSDLSYSIIKVEIPHTPTDTLVEFRVQRTEKNREEFARLAGYLRRKLGGLLNVNFAW